MPPPRPEIPGLGETEYRLNWIPLGGYVKMLGQDDLRPGVTAEDPRAFNKKTVGARMMIVSAGVVMNVILAAVGFMIVFMIGYPVPPATVGSVVANSPAARAATGRWNSRGTAAGRCAHFLQWQGDGRRFQPDSAQCRPHPTMARRVPSSFNTSTGQQQTLYATPERSGSDGKGLLQLGRGPAV